MAAYGEIPMAAVIERVSDRLSPQGSVQASPREARPESVFRSREF